MGRLSNRHKMPEPLSVKSCADHLAEIRSAVDDVEPVDEREADRKIDRLDELDRAIAALEALDLSGAYSLVGRGDA